MAKIEEMPEMTTEHLGRAYDALVHKNLMNLLKSDKDITMAIKVHGTLVQITSDAKDHIKNALICSLALATTLSKIVDDFRSQDTVTDADVAVWRKLTNDTYCRELLRILEHDAEVSDAKHT